MALIGRPNVGKSTLLNRLLGEHVAIVTPRPQTTRTRILGVVNGEGHQLAFFDTPGVHAAKGALNRRMVEAALSTLQEVDAALVMVEAGTGPGGKVEIGEGTRAVIAEVARSRKPAVLGINKMDRVAARDPPAGHRGLQGPARLGRHRALLGRSRATTSTGWSRCWPRCVPESEAPLFPADVMTDQAERQLAAEYVREQVMLQTRQEIPYSAAVEVEEFDEADRREDGGLVRIDGHHPGGARLPEGHRHRQEGGPAQGDRHRGPPAAGAAARLQGLPEAHRSRWTSDWTERDAAVRRVLK